MSEVNHDLLLILHKQKNNILILKLLVFAKTVEIKYLLSTFIGSYMVFTNAKILTIGNACLQYVSLISRHQFRSAR